MLEVHIARIFDLMDYSNKLISKSLLLFLFLGLFINSFSQSNTFQTDSLLQLLKETSPDTARLDIYNELFQCYQSTNPKALLSLANEALSIAKEGNHAFYVAQWYSNKSIYYRLQNNADSSLHYNLKALRIHEKLQNQSGIGLNLINVGLIYHDIKNYDKALTFMKKGIDIMKGLNDKASLMKGYINVGIVFFAQKELDSALLYYSNSLEMAEELRDHKGILLNKMNIGSIYYEQKKWERARNAYFETVQLCSELGNKEVGAAALINLGLVYKQQNDFKNAISNFNDAAKMAKETGSKSDLAEANKNLAEAYNQIGKHEEAYQLHKQYSNNKSAIQENSKGVADIQTAYEVEKQEAIIEHKDKSIVHEFKIRKKVIWGSSILLLALLILSSYIFTQKQKLARAKKQVDLENQVLGNTNMQMKVRIKELITAKQDSKKHVPTVQNEKYKTSTLSTEQKNQYMEILLDYMDKEKPYLDPELTLNSLGQVLSLKLHHLSEVLNEALGKNFYDFVNMYRIELVKEKIADPDSGKYKLLALAFDSGFNSKTAFNRAFKKATGLPPSRYREKYAKVPQVDKA